ncbi:MAG: CFI-box-CTERM domain-containing protein [Massilistercora timonensis]
MEKIREDLARLFDEMLTQVGGFRKKTYNGVFEKGFRQFCNVPEEIGGLCEETPEEERQTLILELAGIIPEYAAGLMGEQPRRARERLSVDYNMNMAVYVMPILTYTKDDFCIQMCRQMVEIWNDRRVTSLTLSYATYDDISAGFKKKWCYITTAVCENRGLPDDCYELEMLRGYRDGYLMRSKEGRALVDEYYDLAPVIVRAINMRKDRAEIYEDIYKSCLTPCIRCIEEGDQERCKDLYTGMVTDLKTKYLGYQEGI